MTNYAVTWTFTLAGAAVAFSAQPLSAQQVTGAERPLLYNEIIRQETAGNGGRLRQVIDCGYKVIDGKVVPEEALHVLTTENLDSGRQFTWKHNGGTPFVQILQGKPGIIANIYSFQSTIQVMVNGVMITGSCTYDPRTQTSHSCVPGTPIATAEQFKAQIALTTANCVSQIGHRAQDFDATDLAKEGQNAGARARMLQRHGAELAATGVLKLAK